MLEQMLKKLFESDSNAASGSGSDRIKANVLSRIESEKPMKHIRIKPLIIAAVVSVAGVMSVLTVNASNEQKTPVAPIWTDQFIEQLPDHIRNNEEWMKATEELFRRYDITDEYYKGKVEEAREIGEITVEKELDETDYVGYAEPYRVFSLDGEIRYEYHEKDLEFIKQLEDDPGAFGLVPIGKSETFEGGLRIVNRHFENINEFTDEGKKYYSFRRIYTDDSENKLLASIYLVCQIGAPDYENGKLNRKIILKLFLDHTEEGCLSGFDSESEEHFLPSGASHNTRNVGYGYKGRGDYSLYYADFDLKPIPNEKAVTVGATLAVTDEGIQLLD